MINIVLRVERMEMSSDICEHDRCSEGAGRDRGELWYNDRASVRLPVPWWMIAWRYVVRRNRGSGVSTIDLRLASILLCCSLAADHEVRAHRVNARYSRM